MSEEARDLSGTTYQHARMRNARFDTVDLTGSRFRLVQLDDVQIHQADLHRVRMRGVELLDVDIDGEIQNVVVNGIEIGSLVEAEMERRDPDYAKMKPKDADGFREAWEILERRWAETVDRARRLDPRLLHERVDEEWSFIETLRHLCYATDAWVNRVYLGDPDPWSPLDLPFDTAGDLKWPHDNDIRPSLDEVLAVRAERQATVRRILAGLTDADLGGQTTPVEGDGWPRADSYQVAEALRVVVNEEWHHRRYAERDLAVLEALG
jgi:uncharacterized protein YjbI with pentapeptide repeats